MAVESREIIRSAMVWADASLWPSYTRLYHVQHVSLAVASISPPDVPDGMTTAESSCQPNLYI